MLSSFYHSRKLLHVSGAPLGPLKTNTYILFHNDMRVLLIDPSEPITGFLKYLKKIEPHIKDVNVYLTHGHWNHIVGVPKVCDAFPKAKVYASKKDMQLYTSPKYNLSESTDHPITIEKYLDRFVFIKDGDILSLKDSKDATKNSKYGYDKLTVIETPGHTPGSTVLKAENENFKLLFTGDTISYGSVGNALLLLGNYDNLMDSILNKLMHLSDEFVIFPGHGEQTKIGDERKTSPLILYELNKRKKSNVEMVDL